MFQDNLFRELVIDNFAGGGGASTGMELALVRANLSEMETPIRIESMQKLYRVICGDLSKKRKAG